MADELIKVLIVDDNEETRYVIQRLLEYEDDIDVIDFATDGSEAIDKVFELNPHVVLMDINMEGLNGIEATQRLRDSNVRTKIVIVSVQDDASYMREAMRAGAVDFLAKPPRPDDLIQAIRRAYRMIPEDAPETPPPTQPQQPRRDTGGLGQQQPLEPEKDGKIIGVLGLKGGIGKTTVAVSLAVGLAQANRDKSVLLVDTNTISGDVHIFLNTRGQLNVVDASYMALDGDLDFNQSNMFVQHDSGIKLLVAPRNPLESDPLPAEGFERLLDHLRTKFDYIVLDTGSAIDGAMLAIVRTSDVLLVMTQAIMPALKDAQVVMTMMRELGVNAESLEEADTDSAEVLVVLNNYNADTTRIKTDQISRFLSHEVSVIISEDPNATNALNASRPLIATDPRQYPAAADLRKLVNAVRSSLEGVAVPEQEPVPEETPTRTSGLRKLFGG
jgi:pilus assembly protein CpaE